jgi:NAD(P)-dependent dehydrogenase (short-subunit alcohol dehydrogenase family)
MSDPFDVSSERILLTGASSGLGLHFARRLAKAGATLALAARSTDKLQALKAEIQAGGGTAHAIDMDVTDGASIRQGVAAAEEALGGITCLVNNAGIAIVKPLLDYTEDDWDKVVDTNLRGAWLVAQATAKAMVARGQGGNIVNIGSVLGLRPIGQVPAYTAAKAGLIHLTKAMAMELARNQVRANALCPGYIETEMNRPFWATKGGLALIARIPQKRIGQPEDLDGALLLLCSAASRYMSGSVIAVDGGHPCSSM